MKPQRGPERASGMAFPASRLLGQVCGPVEAESPGSRIKSVGCRGGTSPSGESSLKVGQGSSRPSAQRPRAPKKQSAQV